MDVVDNPLIVFFASDVAIKGFLLPNGTNFWMEFSQLIRSVGFQRVHSLRKRLSLAKSSQEVDVIWYDNPGDELKPFVVKEN